MSNAAAAWPLVPLADVGRWFGGGTPTKSRLEFWANGSVPWLSPKDMGADVITSTQDRITPAAIEASSARLVPANSVAIVVRSGILERKVPIGLVPFEVTLNQDMKAVVPRNGIDPRWVAWGLRAMERDVLRECRKAGTTVASIETVRLMARRLSVPPIAEQRRIIEILEDHLSRLDAADAYLDASSRRLASLLASLRSGAYRFEVNRTLLADVAEVQGGILKNASRSPHENTAPFLRVANVTKGGLVLDEVHRIEVFTGERERYRLQAGDLLVVEGNGSPSQIGRAALWDGSIPDAVHQNHLIRVRPRECLLPGFLELIWNSPENRERLTRLSSSSSGLHTLSTGKLRSLDIPVPSLEAQDRMLLEYEDGLDCSRRMASATRDARARSTRLRRALLHAAFTGRLTGRDRDADVLGELEDLSRVAQFSQG